MKEFYYNLNNSGIVIFWSIVFLFFFFLFIIIALFIKNKEIKKKRNILKEQLEEDKIKYELLEKKYEQLKEEHAEKDNLKKENNKLSELVETKLEKKSEIKEIEIKNPKINLGKSIEQEGNNQLKLNNALKEETKKEIYKTNFKPTNYQTSPINLKKMVEDVEQEKQDDLEEGLNSFNDTEIVDADNDGNISFVSEVSKKLEEAALPSTIELTDYEKKQEEEAIISYKELVENKDKLYNITDDEENVNFIEELKSFREDL